MTTPSTADLRRLIASKASEFEGDYGNSTVERINDAHYKWCVAVLAALRQAADRIDGLEAEVKRAFEEGRRQGGRQASEGDF